jgi:predicted PurR-regulated permease PerM
MSVNLAPDGSDRTLIVAAIRIACIGILLYWAFVIIGPFLTIILWSAIFAVALYPIFAWTSAKLGGRRILAATMIIVVSLVVIIGPATWLGIILAENVKSLVGQFGAGTIAIPHPPDAVKAWPLIGAGVYEIWLTASSDLKELLREVTPQLKSLGTRLLGVAGSGGVDLLKFIIAIIASGFLLVSGPAIADAARKILRVIVTVRGAEFIDLAGATVRNVSRGVIGISVLQALLAGVGLMVAGFPAAGLLSFLVLLLGILQFPALVLVPVIIASWFIMEPTPAVVFSIYMAVVSALDNVLRPLVVARGLSVPMPVILVGVLGGVIAHGIIGLFIGPVVLSIVWQLLISSVRSATDEVARINPRAEF